GGERRLEGGQEGGRIEAGGAFHRVTGVGLQAQGEDGAGGGDAQARPQAAGHVQHAAGHAQPVRGRAGHDGAVVRRGEQPQADAQQGQGRQQRRDRHEGGGRQDEQGGGGAAHPGPRGRGRGDPGGPP